MEVIKVDKVGHPPTTATHLKAVGNSNRHRDIPLSSIRMFYLLLASFC